MGYFFDAFYFEPGSRMTGIWQSGSSLDPDEDLLVLASLVEFGPDQHDELESDFLGSLLPFHFGGFHGAGPDGHPWALMLQIAPASAAALVGSDTPHWPMLDGLDRALHYNWEAAVLADRGLDYEDLVDIYREQGVDPAAVADWAVPELVLGLLAECCYVPLLQIVAGKVAQCAFPDEVHDCAHDVFADVFTRWAAGELRTPEPPVVEPSESDWDHRLRVAKKAAAAGLHTQYFWRKEDLRAMSSKELRALALETLWAKRKVKKLKRKQLLKLLSTPHWRNQHEDANVIVKGL